MCRLAIDINNKTSFAKWQKTLSPTVKQFTDSKEQNAFDS